MHFSPRGWVPSSCTSSSLPEGGGAPRQGRTWYDAFIVVRVVKKQLEIFIDSVFRNAS